MSVNILGILGEKIYILRKSKFVGQRTVNLLLIAKYEKKHHAAVKNLSQLPTSSNGEHQQHFYLNCLQGFHSEASRDKHVKYCVDHRAVRIDMPEENSFVRFHSGQYHFKVPFVIYADFKEILEKPLQCLEQKGH